MITTKTIYYIIATTILITSIGSQNCTQGSCLKCNINKDNDKKYCTICGNEKGIKYIDDDIESGECVEEQGIKNCQIQSVEKAECLECKYGYYINTNKTCSSGADGIHNCIHGHVLKDGSTLSCDQCIEGYASKRGTFCQENLRMHDNCKYGGRIIDQSIYTVSQTSESLEGKLTDLQVLNYLELIPKNNTIKPCVKCDHGYYISEDGSCIKEELEGCSRVLNLDEKKCLKCNFRNGYYSVDVEYYNDTTSFQICQYKAEILVFNIFMVFLDFLIK